MIKLSELDNGDYLWVEDRGRRKFICTKLDLVKELREGKYYKYNLKNLSVYTATGKIAKFNL